MEEERIPERHTFFIGVGNQKGGVAKTTNTVHIATALGEMGYHCLILDCDSNAGATRHFNIPVDSFAGIFEILIGDEEPNDLVLQNGDGDIELPPNVFIIPGRRKLEKVDDALGKFQSKHELLRAPLEKLRGKYDYVFVDTGPQAPTPVIATYMAVDWFLLSVRPESFAIQGLKDALTDIADAQEHGNPTLQLLGVVMSGVDRRTTLSKRLTEYVEKLFLVDGSASAKFATIISHSTVIPRAQEVGKTVFQTEPDHRVTQQYRELALEIQTRLKLLTGVGPETVATSADSEGKVANG
ncbi:MAG: ParA family protein [Deltaproteobacteria bacterium]|nr:ParA family protein [Deltaproteobacteria bacterium]